KALFLCRLELLESVRGSEAPGDDVAALGVELADQLHAEVAAMNVDNFVVRPQRKYVERYRDRPAWEHLPAGDLAEVRERLAGLPTELDPEDITARQFDLTM